MSVTRVGVKNGKKNSSSAERSAKYRAKTQKPFELVIPEKTTSEPEKEEKAELITEAATATAVAEPVKKAPEARQNNSTGGGAAARIAARRQATQRAQQRAAASLITPEHFTYVKRDLIRIATFAIIMVVAIVVLYMTLGRS